MSLLFLFILFFAIAVGLAVLFTGKLPQKKTLSIIGFSLLGLCILCLIGSKGPKLFKKKYRVDHRMMATIQYVEAHITEYARLPNKVELKEWEDKQVGIYFYLDQYSSSDRLNYVLRTWDGDQQQSYDSKTHIFRTGF